MSTDELPSGPAHPTQPALKIHIHPASGRSYHATRALPSEYTLLAAQSPYAYTIWKPFRNEVCAECWKYDQGNRGFLKRRDDEGLFEGNDNTSILEQGAKGNGKGKAQVGAGLWFCNAECQASWLTREGHSMVALLRTLESARRVSKGNTTGQVSSKPDDATVLTKETAEQAWDTVRQEERSPKTLRRWREISLDDFETDVARYVLLALAHLAREYATSMASFRPHQLDRANNGVPAASQGDSDWDTFASLQSNELQHLRTYPELLENHIRIYKALKSRFTPSAPSDSSLITIENVRTALGVDPGNSFGIWEVPIMEESECLGFAVYPRLSFFNHDCAPNARKERDGRALRFVTTREVAEGDELCISYGHVDGMAWRERRKELSDGWFFDCACGRCVADMAAEMETQQLSE
ncbi:hypothetical protein CERSUDRAFT_47730 [Gelatoporia subvermispora B]|uniref:SET domain-containing protein n=1 Tax=Ceriporiopsis subvermispora (strain B) TaxID=914234 RepID=M2RK72_CERS8|nr:hypothetical protein CERSUDRAFT_47730 [Gelatoporia subvermispora B]